MGVGQILGTGVHVIVITVLEQEHGTELDLVAIQLLLALERKCIFIRNPSFPVCQF